MPEPRSGEARDEWLDRCMGDAEAVADFPDADQRFAVCVSKWEERSEQLAVIGIGRALENLAKEMNNGYT
jgi:hypothetical protein